MAYEWDIRKARRLSLIRFAGIFTGLIVLCAVPLVAAFKGFAF